MNYDIENIFAKILREEIPCDKVFENEHVLAFNDLFPQAPLHILVIPKGAYKNFDDFSQKASDVEISAWVRAVGEIAQKLGLDQDGYRIISNCGSNGGQEVPHLHLHILGGCKLGKMLTAA